MKFTFSQQVFEKYSKIKFHENPFSGSRVAPRGQTDGRTDTTKLLVAFRNFANEPKNVSLSNRTKYYFKGNVIIVIIIIIIIILCLFIFQCRFIPKIVIFSSCNPEDPRNAICGRML